MCKIYLVYGVCWSSVEAIQVVLDGSADAYSAAETRLKRPGSTDIPARPPSLNSEEPPTSWAMRGMVSQSVLYCRAHEDQIPNTESTRKSQRQKKIWVVRVCSVSQSSIVRNSRREKL